MVTATGCALNFVNSPQSDRLVADHRRSWRRIYLEYEPAATELASVRLPRLFTPALATATQRHPATGRHQQLRISPPSSAPLAATISMVATKAFPSDRAATQPVGAPTVAAAGRVSAQTTTTRAAIPNPTTASGGPVAEPRTAPATQLRPQLRDERAIQRCTRRSTTVNPEHYPPTPHTRPLGTAGRARRRPSGPRATPTTRHPQPFLAPTGISSATTVWPAGTCSPAEVTTSLGR